MRKYLLPSLVILAIGLIAALAQNINKSIQLSQDPTGVIGVDTNNNVYFPAHILSNSTGTPVLTACGTGSPTIVGTDVAGAVTVGNAATGCTITFSKAYVTSPWCTVTWQLGGLTSAQYTVSTTAITVVQTSHTGNIINYVCTSSS